MGPGESKKTLDSAPPAARSRTGRSDQEPPVYYNSEPSSQPPQYAKPANKAPAQSKTAARPHVQHTGSGVPAETVAAFMAPPDLEPEIREKKTLGERWKTFVRICTSSGSSAEWNVFGSSVSGRAKRR
ncbi:hypothetical protein ACJQWK_02037 [Exserohilum turcicum]|uniref:Uncharacterized protein n=1 Tax=Exserohilum turcicum (strain 28A) TaxID=671987 RepID=R0K592_EXST2|nr:uncharacterized protein SETTUDRAFT_27653 [Exserohilum turcica Et28A]EOA88198.1 hypothetical protein SETTUDRAFT_27653 [Exserohilum turcica Et28A]